MTRPRSIILFERVFLASILLGLGNSVLNWPMTSVQIAATPEAGMFGTGFFIGAVGVGLAIEWLLWYFIARRGANAARIIWTVLVAIGSFGVIASFLQPTPLAVKILPFVSFALEAYGIFLIYRPDTKLWFSPNKNDLEKIFS